MVIVKILLKDNNENWLKILRLILIFYLAAIIFIRWCRGIKYQSAECDYHFIYHTDEQNWSDSKDVFQLDIPDMPTSFGYHSYSLWASTPFWQYYQQNKIIFCNKVYFWILWYKLYTRTVCDLSWRAYFLIKWACFSAV